VRKLAAFLVTFIGGLWWLFKGVRWILDATGYVQTAGGVLENKGAIVNWLVTASQVWPLALFLIGVFALACIQFGSPRSWVKSLRAKKPPESQPILLATDQLNALFRKGQTMEGVFELAEATKPTFQEVDVWDKNVLYCAKQQSFKDVITPKHIAQFTKKWDDTACHRAQKTLEEHGVLDRVDDEGRAIYRHLFGRVRRLGELIAKIESEPAKLDEPTQVSISQIKSVIDQSVALLGSASTLHPLEAMRLSGAANLNSNDEVIEVNNDIAGRGHGSPLGDTAIRREDYLAFLKFSAKERLHLRSKLEIYEATKQFYLRPASFLASRDQCFANTAALLKAHKQYTDAFNAAFCAKAYELTSNDDVVWVCDQLAKHGYYHPFHAIHIYVPKYEWLSFLQWGKQHAKYDFTRDNDYLSAAQEWGQVRGHPEPSEELRKKFEIHKALRKRMD